MPSVAIIDYGMGNLHSAAKAFVRLGAEVRLAQEESALQNATHIVLPGVGAFPDAIARLRETGMDAAAVRAARSGKPFLGVCLGMQLLFQRSTEGTEEEGLGLIPGVIDRMNARGEKIPHMGWNEVTDRLNCPILAGVSGRNFYFVHSYCAQDAAADYAAGVTTYGNPFASVVWDGKNVYGTQFHPEKSGDAGRVLLENFLALKEGKPC